MSRSAIRNAVIRWSAVPVTFLICSIVLIRFDWLTDVWSRIDPTWLFEGSQLDFQSWFPNYPKLAFWIVNAGPFAVMVVCAVVIVRFFKKCSFSLSRVGKSLFSFLGVNAPSSGLRQQLTFQSVALTLSLAFFLSTYFILKDLFEITFDHQVLLARGFLFAVLFQIVSSILGQWSSFKKAFQAFLVIPEGPLNLAILRILFFGFMALVCWNYPKYFGAYFELEPVGLPYMNWYMDLICLTRDQYSVLCQFGALVNLFICIGLFTRPLLVLNSVLIFVIIATPNFYGKLFHQHLWIWIPWILTFSRCSDTLSIDAFIKHRSFAPNLSDISGDYSLPIRLIWLTFGVVYFFPGFQKLWVSGFDWALTDSMLNQIYVEWNQHYGWRSFIPVENFPTLVKIGGLLTILFELAFVFLLLHRKTRIIAIVGGLVFHTLTGLLLRIWFPPVLWMYAFFIPWGALVNRFFPHAAAVRPIGSSDLLNRGALIIAGVLFFFNSICGFVSIYSYPFTSFPGYTTIYPSEIGVLHIEVQDAEGNWINVDRILEMEQYRRENNTSFEQQIIEQFESDSIAEDEMRSYWHFLQAGVEPLRKMSSVRFYYQRIILDPNAEMSVVEEVLIFQLSDKESSHLLLRPGPFLRMAGNQRIKGGVDLCMIGRPSDRMGFKNHRLGESS